MKIPRFLLPAVLGLMCLTAASHDANAAIILYSDRTTFNANSSGRTDIDFETAPEGELKSYGTTATFSGVTFEGNDLYTADPEVDPGG